MDKVILILEAETFADLAKALPVPISAYLVGQDDNQDVLLVYEDLEKAA